MNICKGKTKSNNRCKRKCKKKFCFNHKGGALNKQCKDMYLDYKDPCNRVWKGDCGKNFVKNQNLNWKTDIKDCAKKRSVFMNKCIPVEEWDLEHIGAISKMIKKKNICDHIISNQNSSVRSSTHAYNASPKKSPVSLRFQRPSGGKKKKKVKKKKVVKRKSKK